MGPLLAGTRLACSVTTSHLNLLHLWASRSLTRSFPEGTGAWEEVFTLLYRRQRAERRGAASSRTRWPARRQPAGRFPTRRDPGRGIRIVWCTIPVNHFGHRRRSRRRAADHQPRAPAEFVEYVAAEEFSKPLQLKTTREASGLSVQFVPYVDSQRLLLSRDITQGTRSRPMRRDFVANVLARAAHPLTVLVGFLETVRELSSIRSARAIT